jgi:CxxC-x17-CxxC domain-containing protein
MTNYNQRSKGGKSFGGGGGFKKFGGDDRGGFGRSAEMHQAICANCGKTCEVPFKPNGKKPVYCKDCFAQNGGQESFGNDYPKKSFNKPEYAPRQNQSYAPAYAPKPAPQNDDKKFDALSKQLEMMNSKFDKLLSLTETLIAQTETKKVSKKK